MTNGRKKETQPHLGDGDRHKETEIPHDLILYPFLEIR